MVYLQESNKHFLRMMFFFLEQQTGQNVVRFLQVYTFTDSSWNMYSHPSTLEKPKKKKKLFLKKKKKTYYVYSIGQGTHLFNVCHTIYSSKKYDILIIILSQMISFLCFTKRYECCVTGMWQIH